MNAIPQTLPRALFIAHGGGPLPLLGDPAHEELVTLLKEIAEVMPRPRAIVLVSAHWEAGVASITAGSAPSLIYDYYGFPEESYSIEYPCAGDTALAGSLHQMLASNGLDCRLEAERGFDHGMFVPLKIMYPQADIPCVQLSLLESMDPAAHIAMGRAIAGLPDDVLVIGSGFSFHNLQVYRQQPPEMISGPNGAFQEWLVQTCCDTGMAEEDRQQQLAAWAQAPAARFCHPREEHLLPLHVCYGVAGAPCTSRLAVNMAGIESNMFFW